MNRFEQWLWGVAERMDFNESWPRPLWAALLRHYDRKAGHHFDYD